MRAFIINALLCAMAVCDALTMASYLVYILRFRIFDSTDGVIGWANRSIIDYYLIAIDLC